MYGDSKRKLGHNTVVPPSGIFQDDACRIVIPQLLRKEVLRVLHSAHQGVTATNEQAKANVYLPGITNDIQVCQENCNSFNLKLHQAIFVNLQWNH